MLVSCFDVEGKLFLALLSCLFAGSIGVGIWSLTSEIPDLPQVYGVLLIVLALITWCITCACFFLRHAIVGENTYNIEQMKNQIIMQPGPVLHKMFLDAGNSCIC